MQSSREKAHQFLGIVQSAETFLDSIWTRLRQARETRGWSMEETAAQVGVNESTYSRWERRRQRPHYDHFLALLKTFGLHALTGEREIEFLKFLARLDTGTREELLRFLAEMDEQDFSWVRQLIKYGEEVWPRLQENLRSQFPEHDETR